MKLPPVRVMIEPVDRETVAVLAACFKVGRRNMWSDDRRNYGPRPVLYGVSAFELVESRAAPRHAYELAAVAHKLITGKLVGGRLPYIGPCEHVPGWSEFA